MYSSYKYSVRDLKETPSYEEVCRYFEMCKADDVFETATRESSYLRNHADYQGSYENTKREIAMGYPAYTKLFSDPKSVAEEEHNKLFQKLRDHAKKSTLYRNIKQPCVPHRVSSFIAVKGRTIPYLRVDYDKMVPPPDRQGYLFNNNSRRHLRTNEKYNVDYHYHRPYLALIETDMAYPGRTF